MIRAADISAKKSVPFAMTNERYTKLDEVLRKGRHIIGRLDYAFRESDHPRDEEGKFTSVGSTSEIEAGKIEPPHEVRDTDKLEALIRSMKSSGWKGNPIPVWNGPAGITALTGSHRIVAAQEAGIQVPVYEMDELANFVDSNGRTIDEMHDDEELLAFLKEFGDPRAISLLEEEIAKNYEQEAKADSADYPPITACVDALAEKRIRAAGILCVAPNGHVLLVHRTDGQGWAFPGGCIEDGESAEDAARREFEEEMGRECQGKAMLWTRRIQLNPVAPGGETVVGEEVDFTTFICRSPEFEPKLNEEHDAWQWVDRQFALNSGLLHPGCYIALRRFDMDELAIAKAIRDGELTSPQRYQNLLLIAIRITGTGVAYRGGIDEFPFRDPAIYMTEEFRERCNGLPVILQHPDGDMLDTGEFRERIVGTVFLPYLKPEVNEVWGIAKILDMEAGEKLETEKMSTSPAVLCGGKALPMSNGSTLFIESKPKLLDHIALLYADPDETGMSGQGVWDKGKGMAGVESIDARADGMSPLDVVLLKLKLSEIHRRVSRL